jgi:hypothetical protein
MGFLFLILYPGCFPFRLPPPPTYILVGSSVSTIFVNYFCQRPSFIYIFFKPPAAYISVKPPMSSIFVNHHLKPSVAALCVAGVGLGHMNIRFAWQAWHGTYGTGWCPCIGSIAQNTAALFVVGVATRNHLSLFCVRGAALMALEGNN